MTINEAIKILENEISQCTRPVDEKPKKAFQLSITALNLMKDQHIVSSKGDKV